MFLLLTSDPRSRSRFTISIIAFLVAIIKGVSPCYSDIHNILCYRQNIKLRIILGNSLSNTMELFLTSTEGALISAPFSISTERRSILPACRARSTGVRPSYHINCSGATLTKEFKLTLLRSLITHLVLANAISTTIEK